MPVFEFVCNDCARPFSALVGMVAAATPPACPRCGSVDLKKQVSRFARVRSEEDTIDALADKADNANLDDPQVMRRLMREMSQEMGEDMDGENFEQMMEETMEQEAGGASDDSQNGPTSWEE